MVRVVGEEEKKERRTLGDRRGLYSLYSPALRKPQKGHEPKLMATSGQMAYQYISQLIQPVVSG